ncbi:MAG: hypothetical protein QNL03_09980 [Gammaproteobacteria bacterium]|nr:hypothetical protein [Gammaproteobacteria bacterium]
MARSEYHAESTEMKSKNRGLCPVVEYPGGFNELIFGFEDRTKLRSDLKILIRND